MHYEYGQFKNDRLQMRSKKVVEGEEEGLKAGGGEVEEEGEKDWRVLFLFFIWHRKPGRYAIK